LGLGLGLVLSATLGGGLVFLLASGLVVLASVLASALCVFSARPVWVCWSFHWHPRYAFVLQASPLCGAAPTFLCRRKEK
jgi:hypothetical protein